MDIEILIDYIQHRGYKVEVFPGGVRLGKQVESHFCCYSWGIAKVELQYMHDFLLFDQADRYMHAVDEAIEKLPRRGALLQ